MKEAYEGELKELRVVCDTYKEEIDSLGEKYNRVKKANAKLREEVAMLRDRNDSVETGFKRSLADVEEATLENVRLTSQVNELTEENERLKAMKESDGRQESKAVLENEVLRLKEALSALRGEYDKYREEKEKELESFKALYDEYMPQNVALTRENESLREECRSYAEDYEALQQYVIALENRGFWSRVFNREVDV